MVPHKPACHLPLPLDVSAIDVSSSAAATHSSHQGPRRASSAMVASGRDEK